MAETIRSSTVRAAKNSLHLTSPYNWCAVVDLDGTNGAFITDATSSLVVTGVGTFTPFPMTVEGLAADEQTLPEPTITVSNLSSEFFGYIDAGNVVDRTLHLYLVFQSDLSFAFDRGRWKILDATFSDEAVTFRLGVFTLFDAQFPARLQARARCDYVYGDTECAYQVSLANLVSGTYPSFDGTTCDLSLDGENGCRAHGANEVANGRVRQHPARFGGFTGIPKGPAKL